MSTVTQAWVAAEVASLMRTHGCQHAYIDVGTNRGVQIRKLYEPGLYPNSTAVLALFRRYFGASPPCARVCAVGFEPNPHHHARLQLLQQQLRSAGAPVLVVPAAAGDAEGWLDLGVSGAAKKDASEDWAASAFPSWRGMNHWHKVMPKGGFGLNAALRVPMVDLAPVVHAVSGLLPPTGKIVMKMDCEGGEYKLFPHLAFAQALCAIDHVYIEWHDHMYNKQYAKRAAREAQSTGSRRRAGHADVMIGMVRAIQSSTLQLVKATRGCPTRIETLLDEVGLHDDSPWPGAVCPGRQ